MSNQLVTFHFRFHFSILFSLFDNFGHNVVHLVAIISLTYITVIFSFSDHIQILLFIFISIFLVLFQIGGFDALVRTLSTFRDRFDLLARRYIAQTANLIIFFLFDIFQIVITIFIIFIFIFVLSATIIIDVQLYFI